MAQKSLFYFTPYLPPISNAASVRNQSFIDELEKTYQIQTVTGNDLFFELPTNKERAVVRLLKEFLAGLSLSFKVIFSRSDYYFFSSPPYITILTALISCWVLRKKYFLDIRDIYPQVFLHLGLLKEDSKAYKILLKLTAKAYSEALAVITVTQPLVDTIRAMSKRDNVHLITNGFDEKLFCPDSLPDNLKDKKTDKFRVLFHGNLGKFQRIDILVEVARKLEVINQNIEFVVAGFGPKEKELQDVSNNVKFLGSVSYQEIPELVRSCDLGISLRTDDPISLEAMPVKIFEYLGAGLPVISTPRSEVMNFLENENLGVMLDNNVDEICAQIEKFYKEKPKFERVKVIKFSRQSLAKELSRVMSDSVKSAQASRK